MKEIIGGIIVFIVVVVIFNDIRKNYFGDLDT